MATETATTTATTATSVADPSPLGVFSFATAVLVLSAANANIGVTVNAGLALSLALGVLGLLPAGLMAFRNGNVFTATAFISYGAFLASFWALNALPGSLAKGPTDVAWYLLGWTIFTGIFLIGALRLNWALVAVFALLFLTYLLLTVGFFTFPSSGQSSLIVAAGYVGFATAIVAYYIGAAALLGFVSGGKINLPVFPIGG